MSQIRCILRGFAVFLSDATSPSVGWWTAGRPTAQHCNRRLERGRGLPKPLRLLDESAEGLEFVEEVLVAAVDQVDAVDGGLAFGSERSDEVGEAAA